MEILRHRPINKGSVVCGFSMKISKWGLIINDCTLFDKNGRRWISFPQRQYEDKGEKKYAPYLQFEQKAHMSAFQDKVIAALDEYIATHSALPPVEKNDAQGDLPF